MSRPVCRFIAGFSPPVPRDRCRLRNRGGGFQRRRENPVRRSFCVTGRNFRRISDGLTVRTSHSLNGACRFFALPVKDMLLSKSVWLLRVSSPRLDIRLLMGTAGRPCKANWQQLGVRITKR